MSRIVSLSETEAVCEAEFTVAQATGHFDPPIVPGVLILEALGQTVSLLAHHRGLPTGILAGLDRVRFPSSVRPPQTVRLHATLRGEHDGLITASAEAFADDIMVATARITGSHR